MDGSSKWTVTGTSYLTALHMEEGAVIRASEGRILSFLVDGLKRELVPGIYEGAIEINIQ